MEKTCQVKKYQKTNCIAVENLSGQKVYNLPAEKRISVENICFRYIAYYDDNVSLLKRLRVRNIPYRRNSTDNMYFFLKVAVFQK
jgi:hypothetical protein